VNPISKKTAVIAAVVIVILIVAGVGAWYFTAPPPVERITWRAATSAEGTVGYVAITLLCDVATRTYPQYMQVLPTTTPGATASVKVYDKGESDSCYNTLQHHYQIKTGTGPFDPKAYTMKRATEQIIWMYPLIYFMIIRKGDADKIKSWSDVAGKKFYPTPPGFGSNEVAREVFGPNGLNVWGKLEEKQMDTSAAADSLKLGVVDVIWGYCDPGALAPWVAEVDTKVDIVLVPPTAEELKKATATGWITPYKIDPKKFFTKSVYPEPVTCVAMPFGLAADKSLSDRHVYYFVKACFEKKDELAKSLATYKEFAVTGFEWNIEVFKIQSKAFGATIHPGVALYLKERGYDPAALEILVAKR